MSQRINPPLPLAVRKNALKLRVTPPDAEQKLWYHLRAARLNGLKFRRQRPIPPHIVDFYCDAAKLVIELDGSQHDEVADRVRTRMLEHKGLKIIRFWDNEVLQQTDAVLEAILNVAESRTLSPTPLPKGEGL